MSFASFSTSDARKFYVSASIDFRTLQRLFAAMLVARRCNKCNCCTQRLVNCNHTCCGTGLDSLVTEWLRRDHHRHEWFDVYVGCCTSSSIRAKGAATRTSWCKAYRSMVHRGCSEVWSRERGAVEHPQWLVNQGRTLCEQRAGPRSTVDREGWLRIAAEALQTTGTAGRSVHLPGPGRPGRACWSWSAV